MTLAGLLFKNLGRNKIRTGLTLVAFALPMAVFVAAMSLVIAMIQLGQQTEKELRMAVQNKIALVNILPERMGKEIEAIDPDRQRHSGICGFRWFGGRVPNTQDQIQSGGVDVETFPTVFSELEWTPQEVEAWQKDRRACVVGVSVAEKYKWKVGDRINLESTVPPNVTLEFNIVKIATKSGRTNSLYMRRDYFEEARKDAGFGNPGYNVFWVKCTSAAALASLQRDIDARFANSPNETKSMDENAFGATFMQAMGDLPGLMQSMAMIVVLIVALVSGNTMMMSFRERTRELAMLKAMGFQSGRIFRVVLAESLLIALLGALLGVVPMSIGLTLFPLSKLGFLPISALVVSPFAVIGSLVVALLVGLGAGLWPAFQALRLRTVDGLRRVA